MTAKSFPEQKFEGMTGKAVKVSEPMPAFAPGEKAGDKIVGKDMHSEKDRSKAKPRMGRLVTFRFECPDGFADGDARLAPGKAVAFVPVGPGGKQLDLLAEGLTAEGSGAAPYRAVRFAVKRVDVKLGALGSSPSEMVRLIELLEPADLVGKRVVMQGVSRVTDGARVQLIEEKPSGKEAGAGPAAEEGQPR